MKKFKPKKLFYTLALLVTLLVGCPVNKFDYLYRKNNIATYNPIFNPDFNIVYKFEKDEAEYISCGLDNLIENFYKPANNTPSDIKDQVALVNFEKYSSVKADSVLFDIIEGNALIFPIESNNEDFGSFRLFISAYHCFDDVDEQYKIWPLTTNDDSLSYNLLAYSKETDLVLGCCFTSGESHANKRISFVKDPNSVVVIPSSHSGKTDSPGEVTGRDYTYIFSNSPVEKGYSGSPCVDKNNNIVGIEVAKVTYRDKTSETIIINSEAILEFIKSYRDSLKEDIKKK